MTRLISFGITGAYASFRDPSITSNIAVYYIPSKTAVVGMLGAIVGVMRDNKLGDIYSKEYLDFFHETQIGLKVENNPRKITYYTNHRSLKVAKTKPVKKEILEMPKYRIYVKSSKENIDDLYNTIQDRTYHFSPYLGHAYCPAQITDLQEHSVEKINDVEGKRTDCVVLDETEIHNENFGIHLEPTKDNGSLIIERHLHHFFDKNDGGFTRRILKHWIPLESSECKIHELTKNQISDFYKIENMVCCLY